MESAFNLYEQHLSENKRREKQVLCVQLHNLKARTLEFPCRGSVPPSGGVCPLCVRGSIRNYSFPMFCFIS